jgi:hypothetical protein
LFEEGIAMKWRVSKKSATAALAGVALYAGVAAWAAPNATVNVPNADPRATGMAPADVLTPTLEGYPIVQVVRAQGAYPVENPLATVGGTMITNYGYLGDGQMIGSAGAVQSPGNNVEAQKTEPDKNTYLILPGQHGPDAHYDYGTHFLFQGHELGKRDAGGVGRGYVTRVNLDADQWHRVTLLAAQDRDGNLLATIDGSTWDPFCQKLLFTTENANAPTYQATPDYPSTVTDISGALGRGGYEGIQTNDKGHLWIVEDIGGSSGAVNKQAKQPNSFIYRFLPYDATDLTQGGKLQVLQVASKANPGQPILFHAGQADSDILSQDVKDLHTYGNTFATKWVTIHDTAVDGTAPFNANTAAKAKGGTPFKRPENGVFRPGTAFREFFFTETGDTNSLTQAGSAYGGFGALFEVKQSKSDSDTGTLTLFFNCDIAHSGFDNIAFLTDEHVLVVEDAGDGLHGQRNALDSMYLFDTTVDYGAQNAPSPIRVMAQGRDPSATYDALLAASSSSNGFQNEGDNEITGMHVSDGDPTVKGLLGARKPHPFTGDWRVFYTRQHGDNVTFEFIVPPTVGGSGNGDGDDQGNGNGNGHGNGSGNVNDQ